MNRLQGQQVNFLRILSAIWRRIADIPQALTWQLPFGLAAANRSSLRLYRDVHKGERCFIMANGPSLTTLDLGRLAQEYTFGMNRIYLLFDQLGYSTSYYLAINDLVIRQFAVDIAGLGVPKFVNWNLRSSFTAQDRLHFLRLRMGWKDAFEGDVSVPISSGGTVTFAALQVAYHMGFQEVILIGLDHRYHDQGIPNAVQTRTQSTDNSHFHPNYFPQGIKWMLPDLKRSELAYELALQAYQKDGRRILDATKDGNCKVFPKVNFNELF